MAQGDVHTPKAAADGRGQRPFQCNPVLPDGFEGGLGQWVGKFIHGSHAGELAVPVKFDASGFKHANSGCNDGGTDAVAGDEGDFMHVWFLKDFSEDFTLEAGRVGGPTARIECRWNL